jgi:hypothetical protein
LFCFFLIFFLFASFEFVELVYRIQTSKNYSFLLLNEQIFLFIKTKYFCHSFFDLSVKIFFLYLDRLLVGYKGYLVFLAIIASLVLTNTLSITSILGIRNNHAITRLVIKINRFLITSIRGYLVSVLFNIIS